MDIKKVAYGSGRSCFLEIVTNVCSQKSLIYLDTKYHNLLDILTEYTSEDNCDSFHDEWMARQCQPNMNKFLKEAENPTGNVSLYDLCDNVADCYSGLCHVNQDLTEALDEFCDMVEAKALEPKTFYSCMVKILKSDANLEYDCVRAKNRGSNGTEITMADRAVFMVDKECTRTVMEGMCETTAMSTFDEDWEKQQNSARNQSQII
ncbi:hypothetical protein L3Y34_006584 [Caenorhabditis briggsae]|uniref:T20D4.11-like domain-containing protein n=1 Tax=Caenorhabditis briggsae TaxID=6238 RepID=A0AAE8ZUN4_CAEBR|nr:hypothetical protein L3Y34_006584 [Caenorhabditis briggsae]